MLNDTLRYWLDRTVSARTGPDQPLRDAHARATFDNALAQHCSETTRIVQEFASGWYGKAAYGEGDISAARAAAFGAICLKKILKELGTRTDD